MQQRVRRIDLESLFLGITSGLIFLLFYLASEPMIDVFPSANEPEGCWHARIARAHQYFDDRWRGPFVSPQQRERRLLMAEMRAYARDMQLLKDKPISQRAKRATMALYASNTAAALCLITNPTAMAVHLAETGRDKPESWWSWLLEYVLLYVVLIGASAAVCLFSLVRFFHRLLGHGLK